MALALGKFLELRPHNFPSCSGFISLYIPPLVIIQTQTQWPRKVPIYILPYILKNILYQTVIAYNMKTIILITINLYSPVFKYVFKLIQFHIGNAPYSYMPRSQPFGSEIIRLLIFSLQLKL